MNTVISQNYAFSAINTNLSKVIKLVNDHEAKFKSLEQKIAYVDAVIDRVKAPQMPPPPQISEDRIKALIEASLKSLLATQAQQVNQVTTNNATSATSQSTPLKYNPIIEDIVPDVVNNFDVSALNDTLMSTNLIQDDDIVIEEKKAKGTRGGRRPTQRKAN